MWEWRCEMWEWRCDMREDVIFGSGEREEVRLHKSVL